MDIQNFTNKIVSTPSNIRNISISPALSTKIDEDLLNSFSTLTCSGIYRIGSKYSKEECYIGSSYNVANTIREHINLLLRGKHYSKAFQEWFNINQSKALDIILLKWCADTSNDAKQNEWKYIDLYNPKFNTVIREKPLSKEEINDLRKNWTSTYILIDENDEVTRIRGDIKVKTKNKFWSDIEITEMPVIRRNIGFNGR